MPPPPPPPPSGLPAPPPLKLGGGKGGGTAGRGELLGQIQGGNNMRKLKKVVTNDKSAPVIGKTRPTSGSGGNFNTVAAHPSRHTERPLPPEWQKGSAAHSPRLNNKLHLANKPSGRPSVKQRVQLANSNNMGKSSGSGGGGAPSSGGGLPSGGGGGLFAGGIPRLPNKGNRQNQGVPRGPGPPPFRPPSAKLSNGPTPSSVVNEVNSQQSNRTISNGSVIANHTGPPPPRLPSSNHSGAPLPPRMPSSNHMAPPPPRMPSANHHAGPPPPKVPSANLKPKLEPSSTTSSKPPRENSGAYTTDTYPGSLGRRPPEFQPGLARGRPPQPPPPPDRPPPSTANPRNSSSGGGGPSGRPPSMVGRPLPPTPVSQPPSQPPASMNQPPPPPPARNGPPPPPPRGESNRNSGGTLPRSAPQMRPPPPPPGRTVPPQPSRNVPIQQHSNHARPSRGHSSGSSGGPDEFEMMYKFHDKNELPPPEPFNDCPKTYSSKGQRRAPPPPPPGPR